MKKLILTAVSAAFLFAACGVAPAKTKLTFWHAMADPKDKVLTGLISEFEKQNPDIKIVPQYVGNYDVLLQKLMASAGAGNPPDLAQVYENWTTRFREEKVILPVSDWLTKEPDFKKDLADIYPVFIKNNSYENKIWTFPFNKSIYVYYYNQTLFKKEGLEAPKTIAEFLNVCAKMTKRDQSGKTIRYGFGFRANIDVFAIFLYMNKGRFFNEAETKVMFNDEAGLETMQFIIDLVNKYKVAYYTKDYLDNDFTAGRMGSFFSTNPHRSYLEPQLSFSLGVAPLPSGKIKAAPIAGTNIAVFSKKNSTREREAACWKFIKWISNTENNVKWAIGTSYLPIRKSAAASPAMLEHLKKKPLDLVGIEELKTAVTDPRVKCWQEVRMYIGEALEKALLGKSTSREALDEAAKKIDLLLTK